MFGLGFGEILIILVLALVLLGPQRLPDVAKQLGKGLREFKKATDDLKQQFESELYTEETRAAPRPSLVPPTPAAAAPLQSAGTAPAATAENVPGLEAATAEPMKPSAPAPAPSAAPAAAPPSEPPKTA
jgi:sec-independent protein translocase protein TatB